MHRSYLDYVVFLSWFSNNAHDRHCHTNCAASARHSYETANGIKGEETGSLKKATNPDSTDVIIAQGSYSYTAPDGTLISLNYAADDVGGFQPRVRVLFSSGVIYLLMVVRMQRSFNIMLRLRFTG